jgi:hypothetical protein
VKTGDKVRYDRIASEPFNPWNGMEGTVVRANGQTAIVLIENVSDRLLTFRVGDEAPFFESSLVLVENAPETQYKPDGFNYEAHRAFMKDLG